MRSDNRYFLLIGVCLVFLTLTIAYSIWFHTGSPPQLSTSDEVSGIVIYREGAQVWLRLTTPDQVNNVSIGEIEAYRVNDKYDDEFIIGDLLKGKLLGNKTISHEPSIPFFRYTWDYGFVNRGDLLLFGGGRIRREQNDPYPVLRFSIKNLGAKEVTAVRAKINDFELPYTFGVSTKSSIEPYRLTGMSRYTSWYNPMTGNVTGYIPSNGEEYTVEVTVRFDDYSIQVFNRTNIFETEKGVSIASVVGSGRVYFWEPDLLYLGSGKGGSVSLSFRNEWWVDSLQMIDRLELYIDDGMLWGEDIYIKPTDYFSVMVHIPFDPAPGQIYDVTLVAHSTTGSKSTYTVPTKCQYIRIR
jgi:hypothetical protein